MTTSSTAEGFIEAVLRVPVAVGVIDWNLPMLGGEKLLEVLRAQDNSPRVVVYSHADDPNTTRQAMSAGAAGFCARSNSPDVLMATVESVARGQMVFPFVDVRELNQDPINTLTGRERTLLVSLAKGHTNKQLAYDFDISVNTVKFHLRNLFDKLNVSNRAQAIAFYYSSSAAQSQDYAPPQTKAPREF